jgi:hypothetical protein
MDQQEDTGPDWEQLDQVMRERHQLAVEALNRCAAAGAKEDDIKHLARECGIDPKHITIGTRNAQAQ